MANKETGKKTATAEQEVGEIVSRSEQFIENNKKNITFGIIAIAIIIGAILAYNYLYSIPKNKNAAVAIFKGEHYFMKDSFNLALHGNGVDYDGFEQIIEQYGGTKAGNLAKAYAGICYYKTGDMENAIKHLKSFKSDDDNISPAITGLIGDCYVESGDVRQGISYFEKAASKADNDFLSPVYLKKIGIAYESLQQYDNAVKAYAAIKEKHAASMEATDIEKYIIRAQMSASK
ncbi:MAG: tetratricopeptide repeat protein [Tannerella sp.]|jgi:tetratricopeptide (TPR) repeat protein|nr:tetratricopeptide repeat protein [Tannerella sp.]